VSIVMGLDQHRGQITGEWIDTFTGEVQRTRVAPADRAAVRQFVQRFRGRELEVALEATTGWRFVVEERRRVGAEVRLAEPAETAGLAASEEAGERRSRGCPASARVVDGRAVAAVVDPARPRPRSARAGAVAPHAV
jgi:transposase